MWTNQHPKNDSSPGSRHLKNIPSKHQLGIKRTVGVEVGSVPNLITQGEELSEKDTTELFFGKFGGF